MFTCDKCGAHLADGLKYCDKCGSQVNEKESNTPGIVGLNDIKPLEEEVTKEKRDFKAYINKFYSYLPNSLINKGDRTALMIGLGSAFALAFIYLICFFAFMPEMCMPISIGVISSYSGDFGGIKNGACALWMVFYFILNLFPVYVAIVSFFNKKKRMFALYSSVFLFVLTLCASICWLACEPSSVIESIDTYQESGMVAWYVMVDSLSEVWYLKIILSIASIFGIGVDYMVNKGK
ncbi:MAG: TFIIB-type zinc finger domain-containing protein [Clostridia bacterium]|nr:TFIIB-type zinc finger domain-containing protein [Clostridia bacterium]